MDYHLLPIDPLDSELEIPHVAVQYDGGPFLTYPAREGFAWPLSYDSEQPINASIRFHLPRMSTPDQETFFQTWLFFGLLQVFLKDSYKAKDYESEQVEGKFITTANLLGRMSEAWVKQVVQNSKDKTLQYMNVVKCLRLVGFLIQATNKDFDWRIKLSIASLCELFSSAAAPAFRSQGVEPTILAPQNLGLRLFEQDRKRRMLDAGWCPHDIAVAAERFTSVQTLYFLSRMKKLETERDHRGCLDDMCKWNQISKDEYKTLHVGQDCHCGEISIALSKLENSLMKKRLPLLKLKNVGGHLHELDMEVVEYSGKERYVAISHVWAYGLGNPSANALPRCQVARLGKLLAELPSAVTQLSSRPPPVDNPYELTTILPSSSKSSVDSEQSELYLWIDTICCPVNPPESKALAIELLVQTYRDAAFVLVLDGGLVVCDSTTITIQEAFTRIFTSAWLQRLWTLQEGVLAQDRLWFQFRDRALSLKGLMGSPAPTLVVLLPFNRDMIEQYRIMSLSFLQGQVSRGNVPSDNRMGQDLATLDKALCYRSCTVAADEALCICTLLNLPAHEMVGLPEEVGARMAQIWRLIAGKYGGIPQRIIFLSLPRLDVEGMKWAPKTLLRESAGVLERSSLNREYMWGDHQLGTITESGLSVKLPGFALQPKELTDLPVRNPWKSLPRIREFRVVLKTQDGARYSITTNQDISNPEAGFPLHDFVDGGKCHVISDADIYQIGLLGQVENSSYNGGVLHFKTAKNVLIVRVSESENLILDTAEKVAYQLRQEPLTIQLATMEKGGDTTSTEYLGAIKTLRERLVEVCTEETRDSSLREAIAKISPDADPTAALTTLAGEWFSNDYVGVSFGASQRWRVD
ncbi:hypothetical protein MMC30_005946 [Trapelia coarctata]|nr:hypothetical protein [Trapelia coarctata]